ncbi:hypothetical protein HII36_05215 [Nonomuraea sp. NN258]|uniref:hypothetical protein n=1 Tax=Nonomuraea antri TaxID=2730852 RepID=UPI001568A1DD|nr:hypothetical protein [Nonomuraea antri]NRQ31236.1 hypothetical protein [Nonomuraea antri]
MDTITRRTRTELQAAATEVRNAGGTTTHILATIARMLTPAAAPLEYENNLASVRDTASFHFEALSSAYIRNKGVTPYLADTSLDNLAGGDQMTVIERVINEFGELDEDAEMPAPPIALADNLLHCLRKAAALRVEYGPHYGTTYTAIREALVTLLGTQSVGYSLAVESIDRALTTGQGIAEAIAYMDGQL